jgi:hypothetical protein
VTAPITPGIHTMTSDEYHSHTDWLSSTQLKRALPEHYRESMSQDALDFGRLFHSLTLEPETIGDYYITADPAAIGVKKDGTPASNPTATDAWKAFVAEVADSGKTLVPQGEWELAHRMRDAVAAHTIARELLFDGEGAYEQSVFAVDENGLKHKARFDRRIPGAGIDLKSTSASPGLRSLTKAVINYGYDVSAEHYRIVADLQRLDVAAFAFVFVSKDPIRVTVCELDEGFRERGRYLRAAAIERLTNPAADAYPGASGQLTLLCPEWALPYEELEMTF